jgi:glycosyltransferase involved in cell wall biosynthesis
VEAVTPPLPTVTVILTAGDPRADAAGALRSVLSQTDVPLEVLVGDDASSGGTAQAAGQIADDRVQVITSSARRGRAVTVNDLLMRARGEFVAILDAADAWIGPDKLARQVDWLRQRPRSAATFGLAVAVGSEAGKRARGGKGRGDPSLQEHGVRWLRHFLLVGNDLCHSSVLLRRSAVQEAGGYDVRLRESMALDLWIRLARRHGLHLADHELVRCGSADACNAVMPAPVIRQRNEEYLVYQAFFEGIGPDLLRAGFSDLMVDPQAATPEDLAAEEALLLFHADGDAQAACWTLGLERMHALLVEPRYRNALRARGVDHAWLHVKTAQFCAFYPEDLEDTAASPPPPPAPGRLQHWLTARR